jgi:microcin C transport system ATP-binding protein
MTPVLQVQDVRIAFQQSGQRTQVVHGVSYHINPGEVVAIVGESGSGKSVTALSTVSLLGQNAHVTGSIKYQGREMVGTTAQELHRTRGNDISFIFQEPMTSLNPLHSIEKQLRESLQLHQSIGGDQARVRVIELLDMVGIRDPEQRLTSYPHQLSGGQRQRVMIAMALANNPNLLIADEPTTALDVTIQAQILDLLVDLKQSIGMSMLFITHDLGIVRRIADRVYVMKDGHVVETAATAELFAAPQHDYTRQLLSTHAIGTPDPVAEDAPVVVGAQDLRVWFPIQRGFLKRTVGHVKAVNSADFQVRQGETLGIVGESGSGKTTLALAIMRLTRFQGRAVFMGQDISKLSTKALRELRSDMQIVFQDPFGSLSPRMTCAQIIAEGLEVHAKASPSQHRAQVAEIMTEVGLDPAMMDRYPHEFSGGQRQRIAIARAMILRPKLVVLDEPTSALDMTVQVQIVDLLRNLQKKYGLAYIFISHDLTVVRAMSHRVLVMKQGDIVESGAAGDIFDAPQHGYTQTLLAAALGRD